MSLAEQSQQWFPTSVQVTVHQARSLRVKGKNGTNDAYAIIQVAKDKFSTSVAEKCVAPVWKEEASFDLPLFHPGNADRCTLYVVVMHRAQVGLDKFLGQAVVNLLEMHDNKGRKKTDWFKLVDKTGKEDKARGEVLLDLQFMRNNMSASMFDLSMQDKPRSRISKLKDKVRGKKKEGFSDSASAIVPSVSQVLTDSDGEADSVSLNQATGEPKKKSKLKKLFAPKSNLQRNISQSMSTLGTLPEKNSSVSSSRSSGLNIDSPDVKKKFKFLGHKRTGSSDSKVSQGPFSLLGRSKQSNSDANSLCINGNHVYAEDTEPKSGSTLSLNSSGQGSVEDISADFRSAPLPSHGPESADKAAVEQQRHQEELERRQAEERRAAEAKRLEEEKYRAEAKRMQEEEQRRLQEEQDFKRRYLEEEARLRKQKEEEEEERRKQEEKRRSLEAAEKERLEEASMTDRLSSLFGMIKKKEEKKEEEQTAKAELPTKGPLGDPVDPDHLVSSRSTNPFEDISDQRGSRNPPAPSATVFLSRTAKVSAVKPRLTHSVTSDSPDCQTPSQQCPSPDASDTTLSSVPSESPETFSTLHTSLAPPDLNQSPPHSPAGSIEDLSSVGSSPAMADKKRKAPLPPLYETQTREIHAPSREFKNPSYVEADEFQQGRQGPLPLPDYETLFPQKRHGVKGNTGWDHLIAEVSQKQRDAPPELMGPEMCVDAPEVNEPRLRQSPQLETPAVMHYQTHPRASKPVSMKTVAAPTPPKPAASAYPSADYQSQRRAEQSLVRPNPSPVPGQINSDTSSRESLPGISRDGTRQALQPPSRPISQTDSDRTPADPRAEQAPTARPRQKVAVKEPSQQEPSAITAALSDTSTSSTDKKERVTFDPFPSAGLLPVDPWAQAKQNQEADDLFTRSAAKEHRLQDRGMSAEDLDQIFSQDKPTDTFTGFSRNNSLRRSENGIKDEVSQLFSAAFQRKNSQKRRQNSPSMTDKPPKAQPEPAHKDELAVTTAKHPANGNTQHLHGGDNPFGVEPFTVSSDLTSSEPPRVSLEEPAQQAALLSGGKPPLRAWVSPSEVQPVSAQNNNGGGLRRPHPVKPLSSAESQNIFGNPAIKEMKLSENISGRFKVADSMGSGPYTQLTQDELITLVVKQQADLSKRDAKIMELEEYIDNLLVRVIDEKPSILNALNPTSSNVSSA